jgi:Protein of unknown function (DUF2917)
MTTRADVLIGPCVKSGAEVCTPISLPARAVRVVDPRDLALAIHCIAGCVWITQAGDRRDYVLEPRERFTASGAGVVAIMALEDSDIIVSSASSDGATGTPALAAAHPKK